MLFEDFSISSSDSHFAQQSGTILAILVEGQPRNFCSEVNKIIKNFDPEPYAKYQKPSLKGSQDIVLTRRFYYYNGKGP